LFTITIGSSCVGRLLKNSNLQVLDIGSNSIGDDGILVIIEGLLCSKALTEVIMADCGILAKGTISNSRVRVLSIMVGTHH